MNLKVSDAKREEGFTLIELLVVVIIIGILAAIAIPVFLNQRERAWQRTAESDARNAAIAMESFYNVNFEYPATITEPDPGECEEVVADEEEICASRGVTLEYAPVVDGTTNVGFTIEATHDQISDDGPHATYNSTAGGIQ